MVMKDSSQGFIFEKTKRWVHIPSTVSSYKFDKFVWHDEIMLWVSKNEYRAWKYWLRDLSNKKRLISFCFQLFGSLELQVLIWKLKYEDKAKTLQAFNTKLISQSSLSTDAIFLGSLFLIKNDNKITSIDTLAQQARIFL